MFSISIGDFDLICHNGPTSAIWSEYRSHTRLLDEFDIDDTEGEACHLAVRRHQQWPLLVVTQRCKLPGMFDPHALLVPETNVLLLGVGERLLAYCLDGPSRLWEDWTECGVWGWSRHGNHILLSAELELAAWDMKGNKLWTTFVEPPWEYKVSEGVVSLDVMGNTSSFSLEKGPNQSC